MVYIIRVMGDRENNVLPRREMLKTTFSVMVASAAFRIGAVTADAQTAATTAKLTIVNQLSPLNGRRPVRPQTRYIVLHTTEGGDTGSLNQLVRYGEAHYFIARSGRVTRIIDRTKIAKHAGRSMWEGRSTLDNHSIGIEVSGYHNQDITEAQYEALKEIIRQLKSVYSIPDERVLTHSMVAYGRPNRFHDANHRGRKRCGMLFADSNVRTRLNLKAAPDRDPDVTAGRLIVADKELYNYLFSAGRTNTSLVALSAQTSNQAKPVATKKPPVELPVVPPAEPHVEVATVPTTVEVEEIAVETGVVETEEIVVAETATTEKTVETAATAPKTETKTAAKTATAPPKPTESQIITLSRTAWQIARERYDSPSTTYEFPDGRLLNGNQIKDWGRIPTGTRVVLAEAGDDDQFEGFLEIGKDGDTPQALAGQAYTGATTIYIFPDGLIRTGAELQKQTAYRSLFRNPPKGTRLLVGYVYGGRVTNRRPPSGIAGIKWNYPSTYYRYPDGRILNGDDIADKSIPIGTLVFFQE